MTSNAKPVRVPHAPLNTEIPKLTTPLNKPSKGEDKVSIHSFEDRLLTRRPCGCVRTSEKLKNILKSFPQAPPPAGYRDRISVNYLQTDQGQGNFGHKAYPAIPTIYIHDLSDIQEQNNKNLDKLRNEKEEEERKDKGHGKKCKTVFYELVSLLQLSVTATALVIYYIIFCYMQLIYYVLRSIVYFHHADIPMKITITLVTVTGVCIGLNMITRMENLVGIHYQKT